MATQLKQVWIKGYEGLYSVRQDGAIRSHDRLNSLGRFVKGRWLKAGLANSYLMVVLTKDNVRTAILVHRIVATAFCKQAEGCDVVNHKDEDKTNNNYLNLEWCTQQFNSEYSNANTVILKDPSGNLITVTNLRKFCRDNGLGKSSMNRLVNNLQDTYKGWTIC